MPPPPEHREENAFPFKRHPLRLATLIAILTERDKIFRNHGTIRQVNNKQSNLDIILEDDSI
jgi:hypothetical protein